MSISPQPKLGGRSRSRESPRRFDAVEGRERPCGERPCSESAIAVLERVFVKVQIEKKGKKLNEDIQEEDTQNKKTAESSTLRDPAA